MSSSPHGQNSLGVDRADRAGTVFGAGVALMLLLVAGGWVRHSEWAPEPGEIALHKELVLQLDPAPMPERPPVPELDPVPEPEPEPEPAPELELEPMEEPGKKLVPEPDPEPEALPMIASQPLVQEDGAAGAVEAIRAEWLTELRRRIESAKYYPGAARYSRETGTVHVRIEISAEGEIGAVRILKNTGSVRLAEGARGIVQRAAQTPLGSEELPEAFEVDVPITYRLDRR